MASTICRPSAVNFLRSRCCSNALTVTAKGIGFDFARCWHTATLCRPGRRERTVSITWFRGLGVQPKHIEAGYRNNRAIRLVLEFRLLGLTGSVQAARCHNLEMNTTYKGVDSATMRILMSFPWAVIVGTWEQHATKVLELIRRFGIVSPANEWRRADFARVEVTACLPFR